ncbi:MAG: hypothetical protein EXR75_12750 [Myxococcales bacterium]|nr:hypothetical protein [Myxococcales bacterium]
MRIPGRVYQNSEVAARPERLDKSDTKKSTGKSTSAPQVATSDVKVSVSQAARALATDSRIDVAKVERLRSVVDKGELAMDFKVMAERIVESGG